MNKRYRWQALDAQGRVQHGQLLSPGPPWAQLELMRRGLGHIRLQRYPTWLLPPVRARDISLLTRQLATLLSAGLPLLQALQTVGQGLPHVRLQELLQALCASLENGDSLSAACAQHPASFSQVYVQLIAAGEQSGLLDVMLERLADHLERSLAMRATVRAALTYPLAVVLVAAGVVGLLMVKVVPTFAQVFASYNAALPWPTLWVMALSDAVQAYGGWVLFGLPWLAWAMQRRWRGCPTCRARVQRGLVRVPVLGPLALHISLARWTRTLATLYTAGVPLVQALRNAGQAADHVVYEEASTSLAASISQGLAMHEAMAALSCYPPMVLQLCAVGEASGSLDQMLSKAADVLDVQVQSRLRSMMSLLEPTLMVVMGGVIGGLVVAMYLPMFNIGHVF